MSTISRIIFFRETTLRDEACQRLLGIDLLKKYGYIVEIWDISFLVFPNLKADNSASEISERKFFLTKEDLYSEILNLSKSDFIISFMFYNLEDFWIFRQMSRSKSDYAIISPNLRLPIGRKQSNSLTKIKIILTKKPRDIVNFIIRRIPFQLLGVIPPRIFIACTLNAVKQNKLPVGDSTDILLTHDFNYDQFIKSSSKDYKNSSYSKEKYIVFLDQYLPFHPDFIISNNGPKLEPEKYYSSLRRYFNYLKKITGFDVVIAASSASKYKDSYNYFDGYTVIENKTASLVENSEFVVLHFSSAFAFPVLYMKLMLLITNNSLEASYSKYYIESIANHFNLNPVNIDLKNDEKLSPLNLKFDKDIYNKYREEYIKSMDSSNLDFWTIVANKLRVMTT